MKKYITVKGNPIFVEGITLRASYRLKRKDHEIIEFVYGEDTIVLTKSKFKKWIEEGYIKEVEEKEFTRSEAIDFHYWASGFSVSEEAVTVDFEDWLKQKK